MKTSKYRGVCYNPHRTGNMSSIRWAASYPWQACLTDKGRRKCKHFATEREAAIQYDTWVLEWGLDIPLNILKRKIAA